MPDEIPTPRINFRTVRFSFKYGMRPLHMAAQHGHRDAVKMLINAGANVSAVNKVYKLIFFNYRFDSLSILCQDKFKVISWGWRVRKLFAKSVHTSVHARLAHDVAITVRGGEEFVSRVSMRVKILPSDENFVETRWREIRTYT